MVLESKRQSNKNEENGEKENPFFRMMLRRDGTHN
jgi:hypothetical protein